MLKHSLGAFSFEKMTLGPNERDTSSITYCGRGPASSAPFRGGVVDLCTMEIMHDAASIARLHQHEVRAKQARACDAERAGFLTPTHASNNFFVAIIRCLFERKIRKRIDDATIYRLE